MKGMIKGIAAGMVVGAVAGMIGGSVLSGNRKFKRSASKTLRNLGGMITDAQYLFK